MTETHLNYSDHWEKIVKLKFSSMFYVPVDIPATLNLSQNAIRECLLICSGYGRIMHHAVGVLHEALYEQLNVDLDGSDALC